MDQNRFDELARLLAAGGTRRAGLRAALGAMGLLGAGGLAAADADAKRRRNDAEAGKRKRRRKKCKPACAAGQTCVKGACRCDDGGTVCGANCCLIGQACENGVCVAGPTPTCVAAGEPCKDVGLPCCAGRVCSSGQGGDGDIACYVPKTGACARTADCVYGMACRSGRCEPPQPGDLGQPCDAAAQQLCTTPGAVCANYTGAHAPAGAHCALPLQKTCTGDPDCTCYRCWYTEATLSPQDRKGRQGRSLSTNTKACCHVNGLGCAVDQDCCIGLSCVNGACDGALCVPDDIEGCSEDVPCCNEAATCVDGTCTTCGPATCPNGCCRDGQCVPFASQTTGACGAGGLACDACQTPSDPCKQATCASGVCGEENGPGGNACTGGTCVAGSCCTAGCVSAGTCVAHGSQSGSSCGTAGAACAACPAPTAACTVASCTSGVCGEATAANYTACAGGFCYNGTCATTCDASNCAAGCCDGAICKPYVDQSDNKCGTGGAACAACTSVTQGCSPLGVCRNCTVCSSGCPFTNIEGPVNSPYPLPIYLQGGTYTPPNGSFNLAQLVIDRDMTIEACGASQVTISGQNDRRPVFIGLNFSPTVTLRRLTISDGLRTTSAGGCIGIARSTRVTLDQVTVSNCTSGSSGGGISIDPTGGTLELIDSTVTGCVDTQTSDCINGNPSGGIFVDGGASLKLTGKTVISGNSAPNSSCGTGAGLRTQGAGQVTTETTASGAPVVCGNPTDSAATLATNCSVIFDADSFGGLCLGDATAGSGACPP